MGIPNEDTIKLMDAYLKIVLVNGFGHKAKARQQLNIDEHTYMYIFNEVLNFVRSNGAFIPYGDGKINKHWGEKFVKDGGFKDYFERLNVIPKKEGLFIWFLKEWWKAILTFIGLVASAYVTYVLKIQ